MDVTVKMDLSQGGIERAERVLENYLKIFAEIKKTHPDVVVHIEVQATR